MPEEHSAAEARDRLLRDPTLRMNRKPSQAPAPELVPDIPEDAVDSPKHQAEPRLIDLAFLVRCYPRLDINPTQFTALTMLAVSCGAGCGPISFPNKEIEQHLDRGESTAKAVMRALEKAGYIKRDLGRGCPNWIRLDGLVATLERLRAEDASLKEVA